VGIWDRMEQLFGQGVSTSKEVLARAKDKAQELGEIGLLKYEISQLEKHAEKLFSRLGMAVFEKLSGKAQATVTRASVKELIQELEEVRAKIEQKEGELKAMH
jgi:predicted  nucleic acid-binding Zn-ribbon protein